MIERVKSKFAYLGNNNSFIGVSETVDRRPTSREVKKELLSQARSGEIPTIPWRDPHRQLRETLQNIRRK